MKSQQYSKTEYTATRTSFSIHTIGVACSDWFNGISPTRH